MRRFKTFSGFQIFKAGIAVSEKSHFTLTPELVQIVNTKDIVIIQVKVERRADTQVKRRTARDILRDGTDLYYIGSDEMIEQAFGVKPSDGHVFLPGVLSRKKQIIPMLTALWG